MVQSASLTERCTKDNAHAHLHCLKLRCPAQSRRRLLGRMDTSDDTPDRLGRAPAETHGPAETYNPWTIVNLVFRHLADEGLHPVLGDTGDPGAPAADLLKALGIVPSADGSKKVTHRVNEELAALRAAFEAGQDD
jgi:hypothetical protein